MTGKIWELFGDKRVGARRNDPVGSERGTSEHVRIELGVIGKTSVVGEFWSALIGRYPQCVILRWRVTQEGEGTW